jgi:hypothetical protein
MGLNMTGVAVNKKITSISNLEFFLRMNLEFEKEVSFEKACSAKSKSDNQCDVYNNDTSTIIFFSLPQELKGIGFSLDNCKITTFSSSETAMYFRLDVYNNKTQIRSLRECEGNRSKDIGGKFEKELIDDDGSKVIYKAISNTINTDFWEINLDFKCNRFTWTNQ